MRFLWLFIMFAFLLTACGEEPAGGTNPKGESAVALTPTPLPATTVVPVITAGQAFPEAAGLSGRQIFQAGRAPCAVAGVQAGTVFTLCGEMRAAPGVETLVFELAALQGSDGALIWQTEVINPVRLNGGEWLAGDLFFVACDDDQTGEAAVCALEAASGAVRWQLPVVSSKDKFITVAGEVAYIGGGTGLNLLDPGLVAVELATGQPLWEHQFGEGSQNVNVTGAAVDEVMLYVNTSDRQTWAFERESGELIWQAGLGVWRGNPLAAAGSVYVMNEADGSLYALAGASGDEQWRLDLEGQGIDPFMLFSEGHLYLWPGRRQFCSVAVVDEPAVDWCRPFSQGNGAAPAYLLDAATLVVPGSDVTLRTVESETGQARWRFKSDFSIINLNRPLITPSAIYLITQDGILFALDSETGQERWQLAISGRLTGSPYQADGHLYAGTDTGAVLAVELGE